MASSERRWVPWPRGGTIGSQNYTGIMKYKVSIVGFNFENKQ
jgi:hypothetical protein